MSEQNEWQPIETAPKDGTLILVIRKGYNPATAWFEERTQRFEHCEECSFSNPSHEWKLTHWMPLPEPPK
jgi:hypothetical protein